MKGEQSGKRMKGGGRTWQRGRTYGHRSHQRQLPKLAPPASALDLDAIAAGCFELHATPGRTRGRGG